MTHESIHELAELGARANDIPHSERRDEKPTTTAAWKAAIRDGMGPALIHYAREHDAHFEYDECEVPRYGQCVYCALVLRVDRLDLVVEHLRACTKFEPCELRH